MRFQGKVVTLTGAASGIGLATAKAFAREGAKVLLSDADAERLKQAVAEVVKLQGDARGVPADVTRPEDIARLVEEARASHSRLDVHVNNAGVLHTGPFDAISDEEMTRHITVNLLGVMHGTRAAARVMRAQGGGHIVNIASMAALAAYGASKFGVRGYTLACGQELRHTPIRISAILPYSVQTPLLESASREGSAPILFSNPTLTTEQIAKATLKVIEKPRPEVIIPAYLGVLSKIGTFFPSLGRGVIPLLEWLGSKGLARRRSAGTDQ
jgi:NAD(P)-dependent dehydrogenase (short-subunit alcohol dehydrogenase family)